MGQWKGGSKEAHILHCKIIYRNKKRRCFNCCGSVWLASNINEQSSSWNIIWSLGGGLHCVPVAHFSPSSPPPTPHICWTSSARRTKPQVCGSLHLKWVCRCRPDFVWYGLKIWMSKRPPAAVLHHGERGEMSRVHSNLHPARGV